jgi:hypothetical protein
MVENYIEDIIRDLSVSSAVASFNVLKIEVGMDINEITHAINGAVFEVSRGLGPCFLEKEMSLIVNRKRGKKGWLNPFGG